MRIPPVLSGLIIGAFFAVSSPAFGDVLCDPSDTCLSEADSAIYLRAQSYMEQQRWQEASGVFRELFDDNQNNLLIINNYAVALAESGFPAEAALLIEGYLQQDARVGTSFANLARTYEYLAIADLTQDVSISGLELLEPSSPSEPESPTSTLDFPRNISSQPEPSDSGVAPDSAQLQSAPQDESNHHAYPVLASDLSAYENAWERGSAADYMSFYMDGVSPIEGVSRADWELGRMQRIYPSKNIQIELQNLQFVEADEGQVITRFLQIYRSTNYADETLKELTWRNTPSGWKIISERAL